MIKLTSFDGSAFGGDGDDGSVDAGDACSNVDDDFCFGCETSALFELESLVSAVIVEGLQNKFHVLLNFIWQTITITITIVSTCFL